MSTSKSPLSTLKAQADKIAKSLKEAERGELTDPGFVQRVSEARERGTLKFGIAMDDKLVSIEMTWPQLQATSEVALAAYILKHMRGERSH